MGNLWVWLAGVLLVLGGVALFWRRPAPSPLTAPQKKGFLAKVTAGVHQGRVGRYLEDQIGQADEVLTQRVLLLFLAGAVLGLLLLVPVFGVLAPIVAAGVGLLAGWLYVQVQARRRKALLEEQTIQLINALSAGLEGDPEEITGTYLQDTRQFLQEAGGPLQEDLGTALKAIEAGADFATTMQVLQQQTHSKRLRRLVGVFLLIETKSLSIESQQGVFQRFYTREVNLNRRGLRRRILTAQARASMLIVLLLLPLMLVIKFVIRGPIMMAYIADPFGQVILGTCFVMAALIPIIVTRMTRVEEE